MAPKASSKAPKTSKAAPVEDDSPQKILGTFAPYLDKGLFETLRFSRDALLKEIKSTTPIYADWALHTFKALYPASGSGNATNSATSAVSNAAETNKGAKTRDHPLNAILAWESLLQEYRAATAATSAPASDDAKPKTSTPAPQKVGKKGGKNKKSSKPATPSVSTSDLLAAAPSAPNSSMDFSAFPTGAALLKHVFDQWVAQKSRIAGLSAIDPCDLSTMLADVCATLQFMSESQVDAAIAADVAASPEPRKPTRASSDSDAETADDDDNDEDGPFTETIFHTLHHDKSGFAASSARIVSLLLRDEEIQIIDPDELLRPVQVEQERDIVNARIAQFNTHLAKLVATIHEDAWEFPRKIIQLGVGLESTRMKINELATRFSLSVLFFGAVDDANQRRLFDFDTDWTHVVNQFKIKRKSTDRAAIEAVNAKFETMISALLKSHTGACETGLPTLTAKIVNMAEALVKNSMLPFPQALSAKGDQEQEGGVEGNGMHDAPSSQELQATLATEGQALLECVYAARDALDKRVAEEKALIATEAQNVLAAFAVANEKPLTVGHRLDRAAKGEVRKLVVRFVKQIGTSMQALVTQLLDEIFPLSKFDAFLLKWLALVMLVCEVTEAREMGVYEAKLDEATSMMLDKRDEVTNLYQDGLEAGIRTLDLSLRNVALDEMATLAAMQRARDKERELFDDGPKTGGSGGKKKGKATGKAIAQPSPAPKKPAVASTQPDTTSAPMSVPEQQPTDTKGKKNKPKSTTPPVLKAASSTDLHSSTSIDGVERTIPKDLLAVMSSPVARRSGSSISRSSNPTSPVPSPSTNISEFKPENESKAKTAADALFASAALTADPEIVIESSVDDRSATPFADSNSRGVTPAPTPTDAECATDNSKVDFPQPLTAAPDIDVPSLIQETHDLRAALAAAQSTVQRAESAVAQLMAEHTRLSQLRQLEQDRSEETIKELRGQVARLTAEVHSLKSRGASSPIVATKSPLGKVSADRSPPTTTSYRMFGPAPTPSEHAPAPPGMSGPPPGLATSAAAIADPWAVPFATVPVSPSVGGLPPGFAGATIKPPPLGAVGSPAVVSPLLVRSPSGSKLDELNQDSVPAHPIRSAHHARGHRGHYSRGGDAEENVHGHHRHHHHHRRGQAAAAAHGEGTASDEAVVGEQYQGGARKHKWSAQTNQVRCAKCFARGHTSDACTVTCSKCGETGHLARMCTA